jgi:hypothetical protein
MTEEGPALNRQVELPVLRADGTEFPAELAIVVHVLSTRHHQTQERRKHSTPSLPYRERDYIMR